MICLCPFCGEAMHDDGVDMWVHPDGLWFLSAHRDDLEPDDYESIICSLIASEDSFMPFELDVINNFGDLE